MKRERCFLDLLDTSNTENCPMSQILTRPVTTWLFRQILFRFAGLRRVCTKVKQNMAKNINYSFISFLTKVCIKDKMPFLTSTLNQHKKGKNSQLY